MLYGLFKHMAKVSNQNLSRNVDYLNVHDKRHSSEMEWFVGSRKSDTIRLNLSLLTNLGSGEWEDERRPSILLFLSNEIWHYIIKFSNSNFFVEGSGQ